MAANFGLINNDSLLQTGGLISSNIEGQADRAQRERQIQGNLAIQDREMRMKEQTHANEQMERGVIADVASKGGDMPEIARALFKAGNPERGQAVLHADNQIRKGLQEAQFSELEMASVKAFGQLMAAPDSQKPIIYDNIRKYMKNVAGVELPEEYNADTALALGNWGAEKNKLYQTMLSSSEMMRTIGPGFLKSFTPEGQSTVNNITSEMVFNTKGEYERNQAREDRKVNILQQNADVNAAQVAGDFSYKQQLLAQASLKNAQSAEAKAAELGIKQADLFRKQQKDAKGPMNQATIQLMEYRKQLEASGASDEELAKVDAAIEAEKTKGGTKVNVKLTNDDGSVKLSAVEEGIAKNIQAKIDKAAEIPRVDTSAVRNLIGEMEAKGVKPGLFTDATRSLKQVIGELSGDQEMQNEVAMLKSLENLGSQNVLNLVRQLAPVTETDLDWMNKTNFGSKGTVPDNLRLLGLLEQAYEKQDSFANEWYDAAAAGMTPSEFMKSQQQSQRSKIDASKDSKRAENLRKAKEWAKK